MEHIAAAGPPKTLVQRLRDPGLRTLLLEGIIMLTLVALSSNIIRP